MRVRTTKPADSGGTGLVLVVMGPDLYAARALPTDGAITIGRDHTAELCLADPMASRLHVRLTVYKSGKIEIEDLGSRNGTMLKGKAIPAHQPVSVEPGEAISVGATTLVIQHRSAVQRSREDWGHAYFHGRLEEQCRREQGGFRQFAVVRLRLPAAFALAQVAQVISELLQPSDVFANFAPDDYEILLLDRTPGEAGGLASRLQEALVAAGGRCRAGVACFPADGHNADALLARAGDLARGQLDEASEDDAVWVDTTTLAVVAAAEKAAARSASVLLLGETGVGKEEFAKLIHRRSPRAGKPFVTVDCAGINPNLIESELFGHTRGAFTGAGRDKGGLLEQAPGGTVFLDEIGELPPGVQAKLLRVLETRQLTALGAVQAKPLDVRFIAATNRDLAAEVAAKTFRADLYHRLAVFEIQIPPLRQRGSDIVPLAQAFLGRFCRQEHRARVPTLSSETVTMLMAHAWPGNVRELRNVMERALAFCPGHEIRPEHLSLPRSAERAPGPSAQTYPELPKLDAAASAERQRMIDALESCTWNQTRAAKKLGMAQSTFSYKLDRYAIPRPRKGTG